MSENSKESLAYYFKVFRRWKKFIVIHLISVSVIAVVLSLIVPHTYNSSATILPSEGSGALNTIIPPQMTEGLGGAISRLTGTGRDDKNMLLSILNSRNLATNVISEFNLMERFKAPTIEDAIEEYREMVSVSINDELMISLSVRVKSRFFNLQNDVDEARKLSFDIANFILQTLDERFTSLNVERASFERRLLEERFRQNQEDIRHIEEKALDFAEKNSLISLPTQIESAVETAASLESQIIINEIELLVLRQTFSDNSPDIRRKQILINESRNKLNEIKLSGSSQEDYQVFPSFTKAPQLILEYARLQREERVQNIIYEFLIQQLEQVRLEEAKQTPTLQYIDLPVQPTKRVAPVRSIFVIILVMIGTILGAGYILVHELYSNKYRDIIITAWNEDDA